MNSGKLVAVVDYGMGNLRSVSQAVEAAAQGSTWKVVVTVKIILFGKERPKLVTQTVLKLA